ncbi:DNA-directed RNA polymerase III subunit RPC6-like isoform X1 [Pomacea canaliculata]|uniref:DNA-directed RNA polymerase III subunit RPC6-like isoform X1 n=1 Tax=Pomacea canaliculata TaxID=400727 RepID=UPI000D72651A|nr:DNA-directed RNA polymerase III subunit RPC6-like isoform X1 [Pomacea canaliculata]
MAQPTGMPVVKQEPVEETDIEKVILDLCQKNPDGIDNKIIEQGLSHCDVQQRVAAINKLLTTGCIDLLQIGQRLLYRLKDTAGDNQLKGTDTQDKLVYQIIKEADNKGIWIRDIRSKSNLPLTQLNKVLKNLENKELIKAVKSVAVSAGSSQAPKKKVYMLFNLEPDSSVTGGAWYSDQDFESELVDLLNQQCYKFLEQKAASAREQHMDPISQQRSNSHSRGSTRLHYTATGCHSSAQSGGYSDHSQHSHF